ncbi:MAG: methionyl-tRNA formyltransferase [bacterium]
MRQPFVLFAGSDEFSLKVFEGLLARGVKFNGLLTQPDRPHGRRLEPAPSALKQRALVAELPVHQPAKLKDPAFLTALRALGAELLLVVSYGRILPRAVLDLFPKGAINVHPSLLPKYRGAAPVQRALMYGETASGVTIFYLEEEMDAGPVIYKESFEISSDATAGDVFRRVVELGVPRLVSILGDLTVTERLPTAPQDHTKATFAPKLTPEEFEMHWDRPAAQLHNQVRALNPRPGAHTTFRGRRLKIWRTHHPATDELNQSAPPGTLDARDSHLLAACSDGWLAVLEVQPEGKRRVAAAEWLLGLRLAPGDRFEPRRAHEATPEGA